MSQKATGILRRAVLKVCTDPRTSTVRSMAHTWDLLAAVGKVQVSPAMSKLRQQVMNDALIREAGLGNLTTVDALLKAGASPSASGSGTTALYEAAHNGWTKVVARILQSFAKIDVRVSLGLGAIHAAIVGNYPGIVQLLGKSGANLMFQTADGSTPLELAIRLHRPAIATYLRTQGAVRSRTR